MADDTPRDPLREILSSPLEAPGHERRHRSGDRPDRAAGSIGPWLVAGVVAGALALALGYLVGGDDEPAAATTTTEPPSTTTNAPPSTTAIPAFPAGYTPIDDGRLALRVERILARPDAVLVSVSSVVPSGVAGEESAGFQGGRWALDLADGRSITSNMESTAAASPGFVTIEFATDDYGVEDIVALRITGIANRYSEELSSGSAGSFTLPGDGSPNEVALTPDTFVLDAGVSLAITSFSLDLTTGALAWELQGSEPDSLGAVGPELLLVEASTGTEVPTVASGDFGGFVFNPGFSFFEDVPLSRQGEVAFEPFDPGSGAPGFASDTEYTADISLIVTWVVYSSVDTGIPIEDVPVAEVEG